MINLVDMIRVLNSELSECGLPHSYSIDDIRIENKEVYKFKIWNSYDVRSSKNSN